jgi:hypothetical protein
MLAIFRASLGGMRNDIGLFVLATMDAALACFIFHLLTKDRRRE